MVKEKRIKNDWTKIVGTIRDSKSYGKYKVLEFVNGSKVLIEFISTGHRKYCDGKRALNGSVKDPYAPSVYGVGYLGEGNYSPSYYRNGVCYRTKAYTVWLSRLSACYNPKNTRAKNYEGAEVCQHWHNFQNFAEWYYKQVRLYGKDGCVDKDLLFLGNSLYSERTCSYIPNAINCLFVGSVGSVINGASYCVKRRKWLAQLQEGGFNAKGKRAVTGLGAFSSKEDAVEAYIKAKIVKIKEECIRHQESMSPELFYKLYTGAKNYINYYMFEKGETL